MKCDSCGQELAESVKICPICRAPQLQVMRVSEQDIEEGRQCSCLVAGILQIFFGGFGLGRFYLGYNGIALGQLFTMPIFFIGAIWGVIDGILILCGQVPYDAEGHPLSR